MEKKVANDMCDDDHHPYDLQTVIQKRIELLESIKAEQLARLKSISGERIKYVIIFIYGFVWLIDGKSLCYMSTFFIVCKTVCL